MPSMLLPPLLPELNMASARSITGNSVSLVPEAAGTSICALLLPSPALGLMSVDGIQLMPSWMAVDSAGVGCSAAGAMTRSWPARIAADEPVGELVSMLAAAVETAVAVGAGRVRSGVVEVRQVWLPQ